MVAARRDFTASKELPAEELTNHTYISHTLTDIIIDTKIHIISDYQNHTYNLNN